MSLDTFGQRVDHARKQANLSQTELAREMEISIKAVRAYISDTSKPMAHRLTRLASILNVTEDWLVSGLDCELRVPEGDELKAAIEEARFRFAKHNKVPAEQVEILFQFRFPPSPVGTVFPA